MEKLPRHDLTVPPRAEASARQLLRRFEQPWQAPLREAVAIRDLALLGLELEQLTGSSAQVGPD